LNLLADCVFYETLINKLFVLEEAVNCGLDIPETIISSDKNFISGFFETNIKAVSKSISENFQHISEKEFYDGKVRKLSIEDLKGMRNDFSPSLLQKQIEKAYELRIFFLKDKFYSMAIFSQNDEKTSLDYRNYNYNKPNRMVPYKLPDKIKNKLIALMNEIELNTGSIDMIVDKKGKYIFLEVNPNGQYGLVSDNCNYYLEKEIADYLM
jgi:ATP-GRASP peptide maturase of grasp-with-spasm system